MHSTHRCADLVRALAFAASFAAPFCALAQVEIKAGHGERSLTLRFGQASAPEGAAGKRAARREACRAQAEARGVDPREQCRRLRAAQRAGAASAPEPAASAATESGATSR